MRVCECVREGGEVSDGDGDGVGGFVFLRRRGGGGGGGVGGEGEERMVGERGGGVMVRL